jgi:hypothetical protein
MLPIKINRGLAKKVYYNGRNLVALSRLNTYFIVNLFRFTHLFVLFFKRIEIYRNNYSNSFVFVTVPLRYRCKNGATGLRP